jgi:AAA15 family ATPase/GTPase
MVLEIRLSNMFSIKDEIVLDMTSGGSKSKNASMLSSNCFPYKEYELLKTVAIYGANASGKSNIIKAITFCCLMVLNSHNHNEGDRFNFNPFKFDNYSNKPSSFFIRFIHDDIEYEYSFSLTQAAIVTEALYYYPNGRRAEVFTRDERRGSEKTDIYHFQNAIKRPLDVAINTSKKTLFISRASQMDRVVAKDVYTFFNKSLMFSPTMPGNLVESLFNVYKKELLMALQIADSDIVDVKMRKEKQHSKHVTLLSTPVDVLPVKDVEEEVLRFTTYHKNNPSVPFKMETEESEGTKRLFYNMILILDILKNNKTLLWDEIELSLHSKIVEYLFTLFNHSRGAQLICTTHNTNLLDLHKMRKDQIYFVNKKQDGSSDLYSLFDYKDFRDSMDLEKAYLQGRFDAIPYIDDSELKLKSLIEEDEKKEK